MIAKLTNYLKNKGATTYLSLMGVGLLLAYLHIRRKPEVWSKDSKLLMTLEQLMAE